jgi:hypothetical protein
MRKLLVWTLILPALVMVAGCASVPADAFKLSPSSLSDRQMQSRRFETLDQKELIRAGLGVLQDLGYNIDEANTSLGVLTASKRADAESGGQIVGAIVLALLTGSVMDTDDDQEIRVCLVLQPSLDNSASSVARLTMQRVVWAHSGRVTRVEILNAPELYQAFFDKLSKATFLEAHQI